MFSKDQFLAAIAHEHNLCKHLFAQLPESCHGTAPADGMRTGHELLTYLTRCSAAPARALIANDWSKIREDAAKNNSMAVPDFPATMDAQLDELNELIAPLSDADLQNQDSSLPWGAPCKLGEGLVNTSLRFLTAYRMQLFLYAKQAGRKDLGTVDCWFGAKQPGAA